MRHSFNFPPSSSSAPASVWTLFASSFGSAVLTLRGGWERSRLKAKLRCAMWRGSLLWTPACCSNDLVHLLQPSLFCHELRAKRAREQRDETALSNQPQRQERQRQHCFCVVHFFIAWCGTQDREMFFFLFLFFTHYRALARKNSKQTSKRPEMTCVFLTSGLLWLMRSGSTSCVWFCSEILFRRMSGWLFRSSKRVTLTQKLVFTDCFLPWVNNSFF